MTTTSPFFLAAAFLTIPGWLYAEQTPPVKNLASGRPITSERPLGNHPATRNGQEYRKLTDGKRAKGPLWAAKEEAVGWVAGRAPVDMVVDLGSRQPISGVSIGCGAGVALDSKQVFFWPGLVHLYVSDDRKTWHHAGELLSLHDRENEPLPAFDGQYVYRNIATSQLRTAGRYVRLVFSLRAEVFLDEIEIFRGDDSYLELKPGPVVSAAELKKGELPADPALYVIQRRYQMDLAGITRQLLNLPEEKARPIRAELARLKAEADAYAGPVEDRRAVIPCGKLGRKILAQQAAAWRAMGAAPVTLWQQGLWDPLVWMTPPPARPSKPKLELAVIRKAHHSTSFNLTNATPQEQRFLIEVEGLRGGSHPEGLEVRATEWSEQVDRTAVADALVPARIVEKGYELTIPSGVTRQIWLTLEGSGEAGEQKGLVRISGGGEGNPPQELPLEVRTYPYDFPARQALHFSGWDYLLNRREARYDFGPWNIDAAITLLKKYRMDLPWGNVTVLDRGKFNEAGEYSTPADEPDASRFKEWIALWPDAHRYYINLSAFNKKAEVGIVGLLHKEHPEIFYKRVATWLQWWEKKVIELGIDPKRIGLLVLDEPGLHGATPTSYDDFIATWLDAIRRSGTRFTQWMDPVYREPWKANQANLDAMDELCIKYAHLIVYGQQYVDYYRQRGEKQQLSLYECYPSSGAYDPYSYFRLQGWMAWSMNANGVGIWSVADGGRIPEMPGDRLNTWDNGLKPRSYSPLYMVHGSPGIYAGKRLEGIREGIYDYQCLTMLRDAVAEARKRNVTGEPLARAEKLLETAPQRVLWENKALQEPKWLLSTSINRSIADDVRREILETLQALNPPL